MTGPVVSLAKHTSYDQESLLTAIRSLLAPLGGMEQFVQPGGRVLLKPNLVFGRPPEKAINTHPEILRAVAVLAREAGAGSIAVGDSPGFGSCRQAAKAAGYMEIVDELGLELVEFTPVEQTDRSRSFVRLELAKELLEADTIINLPKLKTHGQMLMTLAVKNMFGAVPGARKLQWHYRAGRDRLLFAKAINEIAMSVKPHLSIMDGIIGMDGLGPSAGNPNPIGMLAAASDPWAMDAVIMDIVGMERSELYTLASAELYGPFEWQQAHTVGEDVAALRPARWNVPEMRTLHMHGSFIERKLPSVAKYLRSRISPRPVAKPSCTACGYCVAICPAKAMRIEDKKVRIDDAMCIRCYCCHELCQHDGMDMKTGGILARLLGLGRRSSPSKP